MEENTSFILFRYSNVRPNPLTVEVIFDKKVCDIEAALQAKRPDIFPTAELAKRGMVELLWRKILMLPDMSCLSFIRRSDEYRFEDGTITYSKRYVVIIGYGEIDENYNKAFASLEDARRYAISKMEWAESMGEKRKAYLIYDTQEGVTIS